MLLSVRRVATSKIAEEVLPGRETSGSHEQRRDQKRAAGDALHGAHRDKEEGRVRKMQRFALNCLGAIVPLLRVGDRIAVLTYLTLV
jgi:hypothetical protein